MPLYNDKLYQSRFINPNAVCSPCFCNDRADSCVYDLSLSKKVNWRIIFNFKICYNSNLKTEDTVKIVKITRLALVVMIVPQIAITTQSTKAALLVVVI